MALRTAVVIDPQPTWRRTIAAVLGSNDVQVVGTTGSLHEGTGILSHTRPDLLVLDPSDAGREPLAWLDEQRKRHPEMKTLVFSHRRDPDSVGTFLATGADAYVVKKGQPADLTATLRQLDRRSMYFAADPRPGASYRTGTGGTPLTRRECEMLELVAEGRSNREMAKRLFVTEQTVKFHLSNVYRKLGVQNRTQASYWAHRYG